MARPFLPAFGTVAIIVVSSFILKSAALPGPKATPRKQSADPNFLPVMVTLSPAFPSSGVSLSILGASPKQALAFAAFSAVLYMGLSGFDLGALTWGDDFGFLAGFG